MQSQENQHSIDVNKLKMDHGAAMRAKEEELQGAIAAAAKAKEEHAEATKADKAELKKLREELEDAKQAATVAEHKAAADSLVFHLALESLTI